MGNENSKTVYRFRHQDTAAEAELEYDPAELTLSKGATSIEIKGPPREVLAYLLKNPKKLVRYRDLKKAVWPGREVDDSSVYQAISKLRAVLGNALKEDPPPTDFIATQHGDKAIRFLADVNSSPPSDRGEDRSGSVPFVADSGARDAAEPVDATRTGRAGPQVLRSRPTFRVAGKVDVFRVVSFYHWPYESDISYRTAEPADPLPLNTDLVSGTKYRCYSVRPEQFVTWGLVGHNYLDGESFEDGGNHVFSQDVPSPPELWIQIEFVLFHSTNRADDTKIDGFRRRIMTEGVAAASESLGPETPLCLIVGAFNDPWYQWYEQCDRTPIQERTLFVSAIDNLEYVNANSIPSQVDYQLVQVSICDYQCYPHPPSLAEVFHRFDRYNAWFTAFSR